MDGFSYTNIFDTKGVEYLIIIGFLMLIIPFWILLSKPLKVNRKMSDSLGALLVNILKIPQGLFYSKNHTWTHLERSGNARIGLDDLLLHITGQVEVSNFKSPGERVSKGDILAEITRDGKHLKIASPISGEIKSVNTSLNENPGTLNDEPYGAGWRYKVKPEKWIEETNSYYLADEALDWTKREMERFKDFIALSVQKHSPETAMVIMQEGGELSDNPLSEMPIEVWNDFQVLFLNKQS